MSEQNEVPTLVDTDIETKGVDGKTWAAPRLTELGVGVSAGGSVPSNTETFGDDGASDGTFAPS